MGFGRHGKEEASSTKDSHGTESRLDWLDQLPFRSDYKDLTNFLKEFEINSTEDFLDFVRKFDKILHAADAKAAAKAKQLEQEELQQRIRDNIKRRIREMEDAGKTPKAADQADPMAAATAQAMHDEMKHQILLRRTRRMREVGLAKEEANTKVAAIVKVKQNVKVGVEHSEIGKAEAEQDEDARLWIKYASKHAFKKAVVNNKQAPSEYQNEADTQMPAPSQVPQEKKEDGRRSRYWKEMAPEKRVKGSGKNYPTEGRTDNPTPTTFQEKTEAEPETEQEAKERERREAGELNDKEIMDALPPDFRRRLQTWQTLAANRKDSLRPSIVAVRALKAKLHAKLIAEKASQNPVKATVLAGMEQPRDLTKEYQISRAKLWHWKTGHLNYHALKKIRTSTNDPLFELNDFDISDIPTCQYCTAMGGSDRASILDLAHFWDRKYDCAPASKP